MTEWIDAFPITVHLTDRMDNIYSVDASEQAEQRKHTEKLPHRRKLDADDRGLIDAEVENTRIHWKISDLVCKILS